MRPIIDIVSWMFIFTLTIIPSSRTKSLQHARSRISTLVHILHMYYYKLCLSSSWFEHSDSGDMICIYTPPGVSLHLSIDITDSSCGPCFSWSIHSLIIIFFVFFLIFFYHWLVNMQTHKDSWLGCSTLGFPNHWTGQSGVWDLALWRRVDRKWLGRGELQEAGLWWSV